MALTSLTWRRVVMTVRIGGLVGTCSRWLFGAQTGLGKLPVYVPIPIQMTYHEISIIIYLGHGAAKFPLSGQS